ncbi:MAG: galactokinase [Caldilineales bacterium]|nr:galactokinase [Caldilineales bacterium]
MVSEHDSISERRRMMESAFVRRFGGAPTVWTRAPGRVDLMGSHTDYNEGFVLTMSIDRDTWIAARPRTTGRVAIYSMNLEGGSVFPLDNIDHDDTHPWTNYVRGVAKILSDLGYELTGFDGMVHSTVPFGSGLSSSAAIEMATAVMFRRLGDFNLDPVSMALVGQRAENDFVGMNCGILDQYSSALGQEATAILLDCRHLNHQTASIPPGVAVVICDTKAHRELTGSEYGERRAQCEEGVHILQQFYPDISALRDVSSEQLSAHAESLPPVVERRCRFIIQENQRVLDLARALSENDRPRMGRLMSESFAGARDLYEIVVPEMEAMMDAISAAPGFIGGRGAGAGFGGCLVALVDAARTDEFIASASESYPQKTGLRPDIYPVRAAAGAGNLDF